MAKLEWQKRRNLENSFVEFLQNTITTDSVTVIDENGEPQDIDIVAGYKVDADWNLPVISVYMDGKTSPRASIGSNKRQKSYLIIIDVRACDKGMQLDLTEWVEETLNDGFDYNNYQPNVGDPENPITVKEGYVAIDFISNIPLRLGENTDLLDKYRQNITLSVIIE
jgi:hypothetical protein